MAQHSSSPTYLKGWEAGGEVLTPPADILCRVPLANAFCGMMNTGDGGANSAGTMSAFGTLRARRVF